MKFRVIDDGTLDTVIADPYGNEYRYNFAFSDIKTYDEFVKWCLEDAKEISEEYDYLIGATDE